MAPPEPDPHADPDRDLDAVRDRIRELDGELVALAAERVRLGRRAGELKRRRGLAVIDYTQERRVLERAAADAVAHGLDAAVATELLGRLIRASVSAQEEESLRLAATGEGKTAVVVGGAGRMGRWMARFLAAQGWAALPVDPAAPSDRDAEGRRLLAAADLVVCATTPGTTAEWYRAWCAAPPTGVVVDIASIKTPLLAPIAALRAAGGRVASIHPMFGPSAVTLRDADVVVCETGDEQATATVEDLFRATTARLVRLPLDEHDRVMSDLLSLAHAAAIAFAVALPESDHPVRSTTFQALAGLAATAVRESPEVYYEIQADNPGSVAAVERLAAAVDRLLATVRARRPEEFAALMDEGRRRTRADEPGSGRPHG